MCAPPLEVDDQDLRELERLSRSVSEPLRVVRQARVLLSAAEGVANDETARRVGVAPDTVRAWRRGFAAGGLGWLGTVAPGRGPARLLSAEQEAAIVSDTLHAEPPDGAVCWSTRALGAVHGVGKDIVARLWRERGLRPWKADVFKLSADPDFEAKLRDVIGLYLDPPERAVVFSFDEKTQIQALDRTQPSLPMVRGRNRTLTHDYKRNGTIDLFAALNIANGQVLHQTRKRHTGNDVLGFFKWTDLHTPRHLDVHVISDNVSAHKSEPVRKWLANPQRQRWHLHFTPTSSSWRTSSKAGSRSSPAKPSRTARSPQSPNSPTPSNTGQHTRTTTPNPCAGPNKPNQSSTKSNEPKPHSTAQPHPRHTTSSDDMPQQFRP